MDKRILVIDDEDINAPLKVISSSLKRKFGISLEYNLINPLKHLDKFPKELEKGLKEFSNFLEKNHLKDKIDLIALDYRWGSEDKSVAFKLAEFIRMHNKSCIIFLYSGLIREAVEYLLKDQGKKQGEEPLRIILSTRIAEFVSRDKMGEAIEKYINNPTCEQMIENEFYNFPDLVFNHPDKELNNKSLGELAIAIRMKTDLGKKIINDITENYISNYINLHTEK